jgi:hypothetical protein
MIEKSATDEDNYVCCGIFRAKGDASKTERTPLFFKGDCPIYSSLFFFILGKIVTDTLNVPPLIELPESLSPLFLAAGWPRISTVPLPHYAPPEHLEQLAGVQVGICGAGEECATSDVAFGTFEHLHGSEGLLEWQQRLSSTLVSIAEIHHGHGALLMDEMGCCYVMSLIHDGLWIEGLDFVQAMENLIFGRKAGEPALLATPGAIPIFYKGTSKDADPLSI